MEVVVYWKRYYHDDIDQTYQALKLLPNMYDND